MNLTEQQKTAAHSSGRNVVCQAAAGAGKSRTLIARILWLLVSGVKPHEICAVTFTNSGAKVMLERIQQERGIEIRLGNCSTLHSFMFRLLRQHGSLIGLPTELSAMSEDDSDTQLQNIAAGLKVKTSMKLLKACVSMVLTQNQPCVISKEGTVAKEFIRQMRQTGELSFDAILELGHKLILTHPEVAPYRHLVVDEFQDSCLTDARIYHAMQCETKWYTGDDRQAVFGFRGSDVNVFRREASHPDTNLTPISTNFRSSKSVVRAANNLLPHQEPRPGAPEGSVTLRRYGSAAEEIASVAMAIQALPADSTVAVLFRTNKAADLFRAGLLPFGLAAEAPRQEAKGEDEKLAVAMLRAMCAPHNDRAVFKFIETAVGVEEAEHFRSEAAKKVTSLCSLMAWSDNSQVSITEPSDVRELVKEATFNYGANFRYATDWLQHLATQLPLPCTLGDLLLLATQPEQERPRGRIHCSTVHSAKGLEWDRVWLPAFEDEVWPGRKTGEDAEEEKRIAYVAVTRARLDCHMSWCERRPGDYAAWKLEPRTPSRFAVLAMGGPGRWSTQKN